METARASDSTCSTAARVTSFRHSFIQREEKVKPPSKNSASAIAMANQQH